MARKGQFKKGGGRVGSGGHKSKKRHASRAMTHAPRTITKTRYVTKKKRHGGKRRHSSSSGGGLTPAVVGISALALGYLTGAKSPVAAQVTEYAGKIPGAATFGNTAMVGVTLGAVNHFFLKKKNKWMKAAGLIGLAAALLKVGSDGTDFKFVGDGDVGDYDIGDDEGDIGDDED